MAVAGSHGSVRSVVTSGTSRKSEKPLFQLDTA